MEKNKLVMKKLLFLLSFIVTCYTGLSQAPVTVTLKAGQFGVGSLLPVNPFTILGNPTGSIAVPQAYGIGYGLIFQGGKLAVDTTIKDTIFTANGLQWIGPGVKTIGLGGFMSQNTTISGSNLYTLTYDSFPSAFRVNFAVNAGYDIIYRDSATQFWKGLAKGTTGQVLGIPLTGGLGWLTNGGGSTNVNIGSGFRAAVFGTNNIKTFFGVGVTIDSVTNANALTFTVSSSGLQKQIITAGPTATVTGSNYVVYVDPASLLAALTLTEPASPVDGQIVIVHFGGTIRSGTVVTSFTMSPNAGQTIIDNTAGFPNSPTTDNVYEYRYRSDITTWYRFKP